MADNMETIVKNIIDAECKAIEKWFRACISEAPIEHRVTQNQFQTEFAHRFIVEGKQYGPALIVKRTCKDGRIRTTWEEIPNES